MTGTQAQGEEQLALALLIRDRCLLMLEKDRAPWIVVGESLTGGAIMSTLISAPGSSEYVLGGVVFYHPQVKKRLGLQESMDPVSPEFAKSAALALLAYGKGELISHPTIALTSTGYAGPGGKEGLYYLGLARGDTSSAHKYEIEAEGDDLERRQYIRGHAVIEALKLILQALDDP